MGFRLKLLSTLPHRHPEQCVCRLRGQLLSLPALSLLIMGRVFLLLLVVVVVLRINAQSHVKVRNSVLKALSLCMIMCLLYAKLQITLVQIDLKYIKKIKFSRIGLLRTDWTGE